MFFSQKIQSFIGLMLIFIKHLLHNNTTMAPPGFFKKTNLLVCKTTSNEEPSETPVLGRMV